MNVIATTTKLNRTNEITSNILKLLNEHGENGRG